jgi:hypothetical protein
MPQNKMKRNAYLDGESQLPGLPGYRTRQGRSGYDPLDTNREAAFMEGTFYRNLFTLRLRTRNAFYLVLMFIFGTVISVFSSAVLYGFIIMPTYGEKDVSYYLVFTILYTMLGFILSVGLALLVNFSINMGNILGIGTKNAVSKNNKKGSRNKLSKYPKDFR